jgi:ketosteroid isomerase-like protein
MSRENVEVVKQAYDAYVRRDLSRALESYDDDVIFNPGEEAPLRGHGAVLAYLERWEEPWDDYEVEAEEFIDAGARVVVTFHFKGRGKRSGIEVDARSYHVHALRDGKIVRMDEYTDRDEALEAAGISE